MRLNSKVSPLLALLLLASAAGQDVLLLKDSDHRKLGKEIAGCIEAYSEGKGRLKAEEDLQEALKKWEKKKPFKERDPLSAVNDLGVCLWYANGYSRSRAPLFGTLCIGNTDGYH